MEGSKSYPLATTALPRALLFAIVAAVGDSTPADLARVAGFLLLAGGLASPLLARWTPPHPSPLKLGFFACLLSPVLAAAIYGGLRFSLDASAAYRALLGIAAAVQFLAIGRRVEAVWPGRAGLVAVFAGFVIGAAALAFHPPGHGVSVLALERSFPLENPGLAGVPVTWPWMHGLLENLAARALVVSPAAASVWVAVWAAALFPLAVFLLAAPALGRGRFELLAVAFAVVHWVAPAGSGWRGVGAPGFDQMFFGSRADAVLFVLLAGAWAAAAHAVRHAARPWVGLTALLHGAAILFDPWSGTAAAGATAVAALAWSPRAAIGARVASAIVLFAVPGVWLARRVAVPEVHFDTWYLREAFALAGLVLPVAAIGFLRLFRRDGKPLGGLLASTTLVVLVSPALFGIRFSPLPAMIPLAVGAAGGCAALCRWRIGRAAAAVAALVLLAGGVRQKLGAEGPFVYEFETDQTAKLGKVFEALAPLDRPVLIADWKASLPSVALPLDLWVWRHVVYSREIADRPTRRRRDIMVRKLYDEKGETWGPGWDELASLGRPVLVLLTDASARANRRFDTRVRQIGFEEVWSDDGELRLYGRPAEFAARAREALGR